MLSKTHCGVECRGELVFAWFGNVQIHLTHDQALTISNELREAGRSIKRAVEDASRRWLVTAVLTAKTETKKSGDAVRKWSVTTKDLLVAFEFNGIGVDLGYEEAITLGNWFRIRGKEAARNAQDFRHWTQIAHG